MMITFVHIKNILWRSISYLFFAFLIFFCNFKLPSLCPRWKYKKEKIFTYTEFQCSFNSIFHLKKVWKFTLIKIKKIWKSSIVISGGFFFSLSAFEDMLLWWEKKHKYIVFQLFRFPLWTFGYNWKYKISECQK